MLIIKKCKVKKILQHISGNFRTHYPISHPAQFPPGPWNIKPYQRMFSEKCMAVNFPGEISKANVRGLS